MDPKEEIIVNAIISLLYYYNVDYIEDEEERGTAREILAALNKN